MRLHTALRAPNPRRVHMFLAEKGLTIETVPVRLDGQPMREPEAAVLLQPTSTG